MRRWLDAFVNLFTIKNSLVLLYTALLAPLSIINNLFNVYNVCSSLNIRAELIKAVIRVRLVSGSLPSQHCISSLLH